MTSLVSGPLARQTAPALTALGFAVHWTGYWSDILAWNLALAGVLGAAALAGPRTPPAASGERGQTPAASDGGPEVRAPQRGWCSVCEHGVNVVDGVVAAHRRPGSSYGSQCAGTGRPPAMAL